MTDLRAHSHFGEFQMAINSAMHHPIDFMFGSRVELSRGWRIERHYFQL